MTSEETEVVTDLELKWIAEFNEVVDRVRVQGEGRLHNALVYKLAIEEMGYFRPDRAKSIEERVTNALARLDRRKQLTAGYYPPETYDVDVHEVAGGWEVKDEFFTELPPAIEYCRPLNGGGFVVVVGLDGDRRRWDEGASEGIDWN